MLLSFRVTNHRSLRTEQQLLLMPTHSGDVAPDSSWEALTVAGIFGANASGKSNVIDALMFMASMVRGSFRESEPGGGLERHPFALEPETAAEPSTFVVDVLLEGVRYTYGFSLDDTRVVEEWMFSYPYRRQRTLFHRYGDEYKYGDHSPEGLRQAGQLTDSNVLFLSVAARSRQEILLPVYLWFSSIRYRRADYVLPRRGRQIPALLNRPDMIDRLASLLQAADTGIQDAELVEESDEEYAAWTGRIGASSTPPPRRKQLFFQHRGSAGSVMLSFYEQSAGTQALCDLGIGAFGALDAGALFLVDEVDSSLHSFLTAQLIRLFRDPESNPLGAQLVFSSHDTALLGRIQGEEILQRDHIWFTEKDEHGATELFPLSEFKPRRDENRESRYLAGRYGALPVVNDELFVAALAARGDSGDVAEDA